MPPVWRRFALSERASACCDRWRAATNLLRVECERILDSESLHDREGGAVDEAERLIFDGRGDVPCGFEILDPSALDLPTWDASSANVSATTRSVVTRSARSMSSSKNRLTSVWWRSDLSASAY